MDLFFSTGQAARELGVSPATIRALCADGAIEAQNTPGGQYRISRAVVEKLKQTGLPNVPRPLPVGYGPVPKKNGNARLLAPPSEDLIDSTEDLIATENQLRRISAAGGRFDKVLTVLRKKLAQFRKGGVPDPDRRIVAFQLSLRRSKMPDRCGPRAYVVHSGPPDHQIGFQLLEQDAAAR